MHKLTTICLILALRCTAAALADPPATQPDATAAAPTTQPEQPTTPPPPPEPDPISAAVALDEVRTLDRTWRGATALELGLTGDADKPGRLAVRVNGKRVEVPIDQVVRVQLGNAQAANDRLNRMPDNAVALLTSEGEWIVGLISGGDERQVRMSVVGLGRVDVPLKRIRGIITPGGRAGQILPELQSYLLNGDLDGELNSDVVRLANGETITGTVVGISPKGLTVQGPLGNIEVGLDVLNVARLLNPLPAPPGGDLPPAAWVDMENGSRLLAEKLNWVGHTLRVTRVGADEPSLIADNHVSAVEILGGRWTWLDRVRPALSEHQPFLTVRWPARTNTNVAGGALRIAQTTYTHGVGVHSASRLVYDLDGANRFHCVGGMDASSGPFASVDIKVLVDGRVEFEKKGVTLDTGPVPIDVRVTGGQKLELRVEFGSNGDVQDRFDWADAALIE